MQVHEFELRLARVRHRFAGSLESKIKDTVAALPNLLHGAPDAEANVDAAYRSIHGICGVAPTVDFAATGTAARGAEIVLLAPMRAKRGLTPEEGAVLKQALAALWEAAQLELEQLHALDRGEQRIERAVDVAG